MRHPALEDDGTSAGTPGAGGGPAQANGARAEDDGGTESRGEAQISPDPGNQLRDSERLHQAFDDYTFPHNAAAQFGAGSPVWMTGNFFFANATVEEAIAGSKYSWRDLPDGAAPGLKCSRNPPEEDLLSGEIGQRIAAVTELAHGRHANAVPLLVKGFDATLDPEVSCQIIWALSGLATEAARDALRVLNPRYEIERLAIRESLEAWQEQPRRQGDEFQ